jgi:hypothetical protein
MNTRETEEQQEVKLRQFVAIFEASFSDALYRPIRKDMWKTIEIRPSGKKWRNGLITSKQGYRRFEPKAVKAGLVGRYHPP